MQPRVKLSNNGEIIDIYIPMNLKRSGKKKTIISPLGQPINPDRDKNQDETLRSALIKAHRWNHVLTSGEVENVKTLADNENINGSVYVSRILRLAFLAPDIQEAILNGEHPPMLSLSDLMKPFPEEWSEQRRRFGFAPL